MEKQEMIKKNFEGTIKIIKETLNIEINPILEVLFLMLYAKGFKDGESK